MNVIYPPSILQGLEILSCDDGSPFAKHLHDGYVLWLNSASSEQYTVAGSSDVLSPGCVSLIEPDTIHSNTPCDPASRHLRSFYFSQEFLANLHREHSGRNRLPEQLRTSAWKDPKLWTLLTSLHERLLRGEKAAQTREDVLTAFARIFMLSGTPSPTQKSTQDRRIQAVTDYFHAHLASPITIDTLAEKACCSRYHLMRLFKQHKGMSPHAFHTQLRLEKARRLLDAGHAIAEVAQHTGLCDQSHLTRSFKKRYGLTPGQYMKQRRGQ